MNDPDLTKLISDIAKEEDRERDDVNAESWERMTRGELDDQTLAKLIADTHDEDPDILQELYRPIDNDRLDSIVETVVDSLPQENESLSKAAANTRSESSFWDFFRLWHVAPVGAAALAIVLLSPSVVPPPTYTLAVAGQIANDRSTAGESMRFAVGNTMVVTLRPDLPTEEDVYAATSLRLQSGDTVDLNARVEVSPSGAIQITWPVEWDIQNGTVSAFIVVVSTEADALKQDLKSLKNNPNARVFERSLEIVVNP